MNKHPVLKRALLLGFVLTPLSALGQTGQSSPEQDAISALSFLVGDWRGPGVSYGADGVTTAYTDTEYVRFDLDQNLLLINARGERDGETSYQLHTVIYYDVDAEHYVYTPFRGKPHRSLACVLPVQKLVCLNAEKTFRLTFQRLDDGRWNEFGERQNQAGEWRQTFETILGPASEALE